MKCFLKPTNDFVFKKIFGGENERDILISNRLILNKKSGANEIGDFEFRFVEPPKFGKGIGDLGNVVEKWAYFLKRAGECEEAPEEFLAEEVFARAFEIAKTSGRNAEEPELYERRRRFFREREEGRKEGLEEGREEGEKTALQRAVLGLHENGIDVRIMASSLRMDADEARRIVASVRKS